MSKCDCEGTEAVTFCKDCGIGTSDLDAKLAEMRELLDYAETTDPSVGYIVILARQLLDALEAVLAMKEIPDSEPDSNESYGKKMGYNQALADVRATIEGKVNG